MKRRQHSRSVESLTVAFVDRLSMAVERTIEARTRILAAEWMDVALASPAGSREIRVDPSQSRVDALSALAEGQSSVGTDTTENAPPAAVRVRTRRARAPKKNSGTAGGEPPTSSLPSPEEERRDAEFSRLRALLKPTGPDDASGAAETLAARPPAIAVAPPSDPLRLLEHEIRVQAHGLGQLPAAACTARIAAWAGRVRSCEETTGNRVAAEFLLDKLRALARAMDAGRIEALNGSWRTSDWLSYIRANENLAEARQGPPVTPVEPLQDRGGEPDYPDVWSQPS